MSALTSLIERAIKDCLASQGIQMQKNSFGEFYFEKLVTQPIESGEIVFFDEKIANPMETFYAEGFQMLSQTGGTIAQPVNIGRCPDDEQPYCLNPDSSFKTVYNFIHLKDNSGWTVIGFSSCNSYTAVFKLYKDGKIKLAMDLEGKGKKVGEIIHSEFLAVVSGSSRQESLKKFGDLINDHHRRLISKAESKPYGWCSWYTYYDKVSEQDIIRNIDVLKTKRKLKYVLIDDGYEEHIGDWLTFSDKFPSGLEDLAEKIRDGGLEPAIWVAPFIVSAKSDIAHVHRKYLVRGVNGQPVVAEKFTYGGWRDTPWHIIDFSNPDAVKYIQRVFSYFHDILGVRYYKLDACYFGAIKGLTFKKNITRIENYRLGLEAILAVVGHDSFVEGCNAPFWPSLGMLHGMRLADDVERSHKRFTEIAKQLFPRLWMHNTLFVGDPDCLCLRNLENQKASINDYLLHLAYILVTGGVIMMGDDLTRLDKRDFGAAAKIMHVHEHLVSMSYDDSFNTFDLILDDQRRIRVYFNLGEKDLTVTARECKNFFTGAAITGQFTIPAGSAICVEVF